MAKMSKAQIMDQVESLVESLTKEGQEIANYNLKCYKKDESSITIREARELLLDLVDNHMEEEDEIDVTLPSAVENSLKKTNKAKTKKEETVDVDEEAAEKIVSIIDKKKSGSKTPTLKTDFRASKNNNNQKTQGKTENAKKQDVVMPPAPSEDQIIELVGYRYSYPKFPLEFNSKLLKGQRLKSRGDVKTLTEFLPLDEQAQNGEIPTFYIAVYVPKNDIADARTYDHANMFPDMDFDKILKEYGGEFPQELDLLDIVHADDKSIVAVSKLTQVPFIFSYRSFNNNNNKVLNCRANYQGLDFQLYQATK